MDIVNPEFQKDLKLILNTDDLSKLEVKGDHLKKAGPLGKALKAGYLGKVWKRLLGKKAGTQKGSLSDVAKKILVNVESKVMFDDPKKVRALIAKLGKVVPKNDQTLQSIQYTLAKEINFKGEEGKVSVAGKASSETAKRTESLASDLGVLGKVGSLEQLAVNKDGKLVQLKGKKDQLGPATKLELKTKFTLMLDQIEEDANLKSPKMTQGDLQPALFNMAQLKDPEINARINKLKKGLREKDPTLGKLREEKNTLNALDNCLAQMARGEDIDEGDFARIKNNFMDVDESGYDAGGQKLLQELKGKLKDGVKKNKIQDFQDKLAEVKTQNQNQIVRNVQTLREEKQAIVALDKCLDQMARGEMIDEGDFARIENNFMEIDKTKYDAGERELLQGLKNDLAFVTLMNRSGKVDKDQLRVFKNKVNAFKPHHQIARKIAKTDFVLRHGGRLVATDAGKTGAQFVFDFDAKVIGVYTPSDKDIPTGVKVSNWVKRNLGFGQLSILGKGKQGDAEVASFKLSEQLGFGVTPPSMKMTAPGHKEAGVFQMNLANTVKTLVNKEQGVKGMTAAETMGRMKEIEKAEEYLNKTSFDDQELFAFQRVILHDFLVGNLDGKLDSFFLYTPEEDNTPGATKFSPLVSIDDKNAFTQSNKPSWRTFEHKLLKWIGRPWANQSQWKDLNIANQNMTADASSFIKDRITEDAENEYIASRHTEQSGFLDTKMEARLRERFAVVRALHRKGNFSPSDLAEYNSPEKIKKLLNEFPDPD